MVFTFSLCENVVTTISAAQTLYYLNWQNLKGNFTFFFLNKNFCFFFCRYGEMVDTQHSKCCGKFHVGSSPTSGILQIIKLISYLCFLFYKKVFKDFLFFKKKHQFYRVNGTTLFWQDQNVCKQELRIKK